MPKKPKKPCKHPGCPGLTSGKYCEEHEALHKGDRATSSGRGYDSRWRRARSRFLKAHPLCVRCQEQGRLVKASVVDHIVPHRGDEKLFWDKSNWQALCKNCHDSKTMTEDRYQEYRY
ncbi:HNH endonuclease [[Clostridium] symbiosum]|uniref:HNH endonuclease n=1 Tax=Clostridium symbiosum TaxID=1512 RepID=UPI0018A035AD